MKVRFRIGASLEPMATNLSNKNAPDDIVQRLRQRAQRHHPSLQSELLAIVEEAIRREQELSPAELLAEVRRLGLQTPADSRTIIRADRDRPLRSWTHPHWPPDIRGTRRGGGRQSARECTIGGTLIARVRIGQCLLDQNSAPAKPPAGITLRFPAGQPAESGNCRCRHCRYAGPCRDSGPDRL